MEYEATVKEKIKSIKDGLVRNDNGTYSFKYGHKHMSFIHAGDIKPIDFDFKEEFSRAFENEIVSIIPYATLIFSDTYSYRVDISEKNQVLKEYYHMNQQIDFYEAIKTLYFPTMKEYFVKIGKTQPEWLYNPFRPKVFMEKVKDKFYIKIKHKNYILQRGIDGTAIDLLKEDIEYYLENFLFRNPYPKETRLLPQEDISKEALLANTNRKGFYQLELFSPEQKNKFIEALLNDFLFYYKKFIEQNFFFIRNQFRLYSNLPLRIKVYNKEESGIPIQYVKDSFFTCFFEKLTKGEENQVEFFYNTEEKWDTNKYIYGHGHRFSSLLHSYRNHLPYLYSFVEDELEEIISKIANYTIFEDFKPFESTIESWIQLILATEKKGGETANIELKIIPKESNNKDGSGNDLYGHINSFENGDGGYIFIGVDESKQGLDKIIGIEPFLRSTKKTIDQVKREIQEKSMKYLKKWPLLEVNQYKGKTLIRIKIHSNKGNISNFYPENGDPCAFIRLNGKKEKMTPEQIFKHIKKNLIK